MRHQRLLKLKQDLLRFETMVIGPMDTALGQLGASLQEELNLILQPLVEQIVIQSTQTCVDLCKARLSELLDENETLGIPIINILYSSILNPIQYMKHPVIVPVC